jgi:transcription elongation factor Elf1
MMLYVLHSRPPKANQIPRIVTLQERTFTCPYCWEQISVFLDPSVREQTYIEDCEVCCRPMHIEYRAKHGNIVSFNVRQTAGQS